MAKKYFLIFIIGAVLGTLYDGIHVMFGVLSYNTPHFWGTSSWVPLEFGLSAVLGAALINKAATVLSMPNVTPLRMAFDAVALLAAYLCTGVFKGQDALIMPCLAFISVLVVGSRFSRTAISFALACAILGPAGELSTQYIGLFHYNVASSIPVWLPLLWAVASGIFVDVPVVVFKLA